MSTVEEPENHFNIDEYTDVVMVTKPVIYISVQEICDTHTLLLEHSNEIAPDPNDPLHELLDDLGDAPSVEALLGMFTCPPVSKYKFSIFVSIHFLQTKRRESVKISTDVNLSDHVLSSHDSANR